MKDLKKILEQEKLKGSKLPTRTVSHKEYKILEQMAKENKLDMTGFPKLDFFDEYVKKLKE